MDVMKPDLCWVNETCYRLNPVVLPGATSANNEKPKVYEEDVECPSDEDNEESCEYPVELTDMGRYRISFHVPRPYYPFVIGAKGGVLHRLEAETKTQIRVPRQMHESNVVITGENAKGVRTAYRRIKLIVASARNRQPFTHFLSIPFTSENIKSNFLEFKKQVLEVCQNRGIETSIFQSPDKLHLTLGTLTLADNEERNKAVEILEEFKKSRISEILTGKSLKVHMIGVEYMNDDPAEVDVLYGKVQLEDNSPTLHTLADSIIDFFVSKDLMRKQYEKVKLHVTLMNTMFRQDDGDIPVKDFTDHRGKPRYTFDATEVLRKFEFFDFGKQSVDSIHLSQRYTTGGNGYYKSTAFIKLNS